MQDDSVKPKVRFGRRLRQLRKANRLSQEGLAERAGLDRTYVSSCERGRRNVSLLNIYRLAEALNTDPSLLLADPDDAPDDEEGP